MQHGTAPDERGPRRSHEGHGHDRDIVGFRGEPAVVHLFRKSVDPQHHGDVRSVDIRVEDAHLRAEFCQGDGEVHRCGRLSDAALSARHGNHVPDPFDFRLPLLRPASGRPGRHADVDGTDSLDGGKGLHTGFLDFFLERTGRSRENHGKGHMAILDLEIFNHLQRDKILFEVRFDHATQGLHDCLSCFLVFFLIHGCSLIGCGSSYPL